MRVAQPLSALVLGAALCAVPTLAPADAHPSDTSSASAPLHLAPVVGDARRGGAVIVWLTDQHRDLDLGTHNAQRTRLSQADQLPLVAAIEAAGGTHVLSLISVNAVAAHVSASEVQVLRTRPDVLKILPDSIVTVGDPAPRGPQATGRPTLDPFVVKQARRSTATNPFPASQCGTQAKPLVEPEALDDIKAPVMTNAGLTTEPGNGVVVANAGLSIPILGDLVGNPNFVRPAADGGGTVVNNAVPGDTTDSTDGEYYGDASSIDAQGTVKYQYSLELPFSGLPATCYFVLEGDAPGASLVDTSLIDTPPSGAGDATPDRTGLQPNQRRSSELIAGTDRAIVTHADVINESYGYSQDPGSYASNYASNDSAVAAGVTVVVSSGDAGPQGTVSSPATDPLVIAAGATNTLRENAMAYGYTDWVNDDITPLSSGATSPNDKVVDLVAPGYGGEAACNPQGSDCPTNTQTEAFGGTSEAAPLIAGAAADVIQAYRDSHGATSPTPAVVKQILTGTATDVDAPADLQGAGLVDIAAAVNAAKQFTGTTVTTPSPTPGVLPTPTQLDVTAAAGSSSSQSVSLYNADSVATTVTGTYRALGPETQIGSSVTQPVTSPAAPYPNDGAQASPNITIDVPAGLDRLNATMIWPDSTNNAILNMVLTDPQGRLRQISYDYGGAGTTPNIQRVQVAHPEAGAWTAQIKWGNGRSHLQEEPNTPGTYTGTMSFKATGQKWVTSPASPAISIPAHSSATVPLSVAMPTAPGDHPQSVQFTQADGAVSSVPIARRSLVPSYGGEFDTTITNTVSRGVGQITSYDVTVPAGQADLGIGVYTPDTSADDPFTLFLVDPSGDSVAMTGTGATASNGVALTTAPVHGTPMQTVVYHQANPAAGTWEIDVQLDLTTSGKEFEQLVTGDVFAQAPVITAPVTGSTAATTTPTISGTGAPDHTVTVVGASGATVCTAAVKPDGTWSCVPSAQPQGSETLTATQADATGYASAVSHSVAVTIPAPVTAIALTLSPTAPARGQAVVLTGTTNTVVSPDGTVATFYDGTTVLGTGTVSAARATLSLPGGFAVGSHDLTVSVPLTATSQAATSAPVDVVVPKTPTTTALSLSPGAPARDQAVVLTATTTQVPDGTTATFLDGSTTLGTGTVSGNRATLSLPGGFAVGTHHLTASVPETAVSLASTSAADDLSVAKTGSTIAVSLAKATITYGHRVTGSVHVAHATGGTAVVGYGSTRRTVRLDSDGAGTFTLPGTLAVGVRTVKAAYAGTATVAASGPVSTTLEVTRAPTRLRLSLARLRDPHGVSETVTVTLHGHAYGLYPGGTIRVLATIGGRGRTTYLTLPASDHGRSTFQVRMPTRIGTVKIVAKYLGNSSFARSEAPTLTAHTV